MKIWKKEYYEKLFADSPKTVGDYQLQIARAQDKIKELQAKCPHTDFKVGWFSWRPGAMQPSRICTSCGFLIGYATEEEARQLRDSCYTKV